MSWQGKKEGSSNTGTAYGFVIVSSWDPGWACLSHKKLWFLSQKSLYSNVEM